MVRIAGILGWPFETITPVTGAVTIAAIDANVNVLRCDSGMPATITLPPISAMVASQNPSIIVMNKSSSGGTATIACNSADSIVGATTAAVSTGRICQHDGIHTWFIR